MSPETARPGPSEQVPSKALNIQGGPHSQFDRKEGRPVN
jgi:hypothetical protein